MLCAHCFSIQQMNAQMKIDREVQVPEFEGLPVVELALGDSPVSGTNGYSW
jgi:hypothetical protein